MVVNALMFRFTGPTRLSKMTFVELVLSRRSPSNSASREFRLTLRDASSNVGSPLRVKAFSHCLSRTPADNCWRSASRDTQNLRENPIEDAQQSLWGGGKVSHLVPWTLGVRLR